MKYKIAWYLTVSAYCTVSAMIAGNRPVAEISLRQGVLVVAYSIAGLYLLATAIEALRTYWRAK